MLLIFSVLLAIAITAFICFIYYLIMVDKIMHSIAIVVGISYTELTQKILNYKLNEEETNKVKVTVSIELHKDTYYAFLTQTDRFIDQHTSIDSLKELVLKKYPTAEFI